MPDSGAVFDAAADRLLISTAPLNYNADYTVIMRARLNTDLNAIGCFCIITDNGLNGDFIGVTTDGTGLNISAIVSGVSNFVVGTQLKVGFLNTLALVRRGNRLEGWLNGRLDCFVNASISGRAAATRFEFGAATSSNVNRIDGVIGNIIAYQRALDPRDLVAQMACFDRALFPNPYGNWQTAKGTGFRALDLSPNRRNFTEGGTLADGSLEPVPFDPINRWMVRGPITWLLTVSGAVTPAGDVIRRTNKVLTGGITPSGALAAIRLAVLIVVGAITPSGTLTKRANKIFSGGVTPTGDVTKRPTKLLAGGITPTGALANVKVALLFVTGQITPTGALTKRPTKVVSGSVTPSGSLISQARKALSGGITPAGALSAIKTALLSLTGSVTPSGTLTKRPTKPVSGSVTPTGALIDTPKKLVSGAVAPVGTLIKQVNKVLTGGITPAGVLSNVKVALLFISGSITPSGTLTKRPTKPTSGAVTPTGALINQARKVLSGGVTPAGVVVNVKVALSFLSGSVTPTGALRTLTTKRLSGTVAPVGTVVKSARKLLGGVIGAIGDFIGTLVGGGPVMEIDLDPDVYSSPRRNEIYAASRANDAFETARPNPIFAAPVRNRIAVSERRNDVYQVED